MSLKNIARTSVITLSNFAVLGLCAASALAQNPAVPSGSAPAAGNGMPAQPGIGGMLVPFLAMFAVVYFLMIRPQQKKMREQQQMIAALQQGDEVITSSGILGKITGIADKVIIIEVSDNVRIRVLKSHIAQVVKGQIKDLG